MTLACMSQKLWFFVVGLLWVTGLKAQNALYVEHQGKGRLVRAARNNQPCIEIKGKLQAVPGSRIALRPVADFLPVFVSIHNIDVRSFQLNLMETGQSMNHEMHFAADFVSPYALEHVFLLLDLDSEESGKGYFIYEIGTLQPYKSKALNLTVPLTRPLGQGHYKIHLFSDGAELLHSEIPFAVREAALDRMIARQVEKSSDSNPKPFIGPLPQYPARLKKSKIEGSAVIGVRISTAGAVLDPQIVSATAPEFGEAALAAARLWRFLPAIRKGHAIEIKAQMPFDFKDPSEN